MGGLDTTPYLSPGGLEVVLQSSRGGRLITTTDADGGFSFIADTGDYAVSTEPPGFSALQRAFIHLDPGGLVDVGVLQPLWRGGVVGVSGKVTVQGGGDPTGAEVEFLLLPQRRRVALAAVGVSGDFVERVPPGNYVLRASHPLFVTVTTAEQRFDEGPDVEVMPIVLQIDPASLTGHVLKERDGEAPVPASGVTVTVEPQGVTTTTDANGDFSLTGLSSGLRRVRFALADFHDPAPLHEVVLAPGLPSVLADVRLALDRGDVTGSVQLADRQPATSVAVGISAARKATTVVQDPVEPWKGTFTLTGVPVGSWEIAVTRQGYARATRGGVQIVADRATDVGALTLTKLQGDFLIDDGDTSNTAGYTRTTAVTLQLTGFSGAADFHVSEDPNFPDAGYVPFTGASQGFTLATTQGSHLVYAQYRDSTGTESPVFLSSIVLDSLPPSMPEIVINDGADFSTRAQPLALRLVATDTAPGVVDQVSGLREVRLSESPTVDGQGRLAGPPRTYVRDDSFTRSSAADGPVRIHAQFFDHAGNQTAVVFDDVVIDTQAPAGGLTIRRGARATDPAYTHVERVMLDLAAPDGGVLGAEANGSPLYLRLAHTQAQLTTAAAVPLSTVMVHELEAQGADGAREVWYVLRDAAGNQTSPAMQSITLDRTAPVVTSFSLGVTSPTRVVAFPLSWSVTDAIGFSLAQALTISDDPFFQSAGTVGPMALPGSSSTPYSPPGGDGSRVVYARFRDRAGNEAFASGRVEVDRTAPTGTLLLEGRLGDGSVSALNTSQAAITALVLHQGATELVLGDEAMMVCPTTGYTPVPADGRQPVTLSLAQGPRTVKMCLRDAAGNTSVMLSAGIRFELAAPTGCSLTTQGYRADTGLAPALRTAKPIITIGLSGCSTPPAEWVVVDGAVTCSMPGLAWETFGAGPFALSGSDGIHTLNACVRSETRNVATLAPVNIDLDSTPPLGPLLVLDSNATWVNLAGYTARGSAFSAPAQGTVTGAVDWSLSETTTFTAWLPFATNNPRTWTFPGTGARRLFAVFRDDLGNTTSPVSDDITFDIVPPATTGLSLSLQTGSPDPTFVATGNFALAVVSAPPADAVGALVAQVAPATLCTAAGVFSGVLPRPVEANIGVVALGGDGQKRVCVSWLDAAGNPSSAVGLTLTVDTTPPSPPEISTADALVNLPQGATFGVDLVRPIIETNFLRTEMTGGTLSAWATASTLAATTHFDFSLNANSGLENITNTLQLRAVDRAGNVGPVSEVHVVTDVKAPQAPTLDVTGVSNLSGAGSVFWATPLETDLARYFVDYGPASGQYNGTVASEGASPVTVAPDVTQVTLHSLTNGSPVYVKMRAQDRAGNISFDSTEVVLQPNVMSPTLVASTDLANTREVTDIEIDRDVAYVVGTDVNCFNFTPPATPTETVLSALDLSGLKSATQSGRLVLSAPPPMLWSLRFAEPQSQFDCNGVATDLLVDGPFAYLATNERIRIFRMGRRTTAPTVISTLTLPWKVRSLALQGNTLFANGASGVMAIDVGSLFDDAAGTRPSVASPIGTLSTTPYAETGSIATAGMAVSRNRLLQFGQNSGTGANYWNLPDALDGNPVTLWNDLDYVTAVDNVSFPALRRMPVVSGNLTFSYNDGKVQSRDVKALWAGAPTAAPVVASVSLGINLSGPLTLAGSGAWGTHENGDAVVSVDLQRATGGLATLGGRLQVDPTKRLRSVKAWGPYLVASTRGGQVQFFELATPRNLRPVSQLAGGSPQYVVDGPLMYGANGSVLDLHGGAAPSELGPVAQIYGTSNAFDLVDLAVFGDEAVAAFGAESKLRVWNFRKSNDRDATTVMGVAPLTDGYDVPLPSVLRVMQVEAWGGALVAVEYRADGFYLEVFDANAVRDGNPATSLAASASKGAIRFSPVTATVPDVGLTLSHGRAFVTINTNLASVVPASVFAIDFRNLVDDDGTTTGLVLQGTLPVADARDVVVSGNRAFVSTWNSLEAWDVGPAMDDAPGTSLVATAATGTLALDSPAELEAWGTRVFALNRGSGFSARTWAVDFSNVATPQISTLSLVGGVGGGVSGTNGQVYLRNAIHVAGEYVIVSGGVSSFASTTVMAME